MNILTLLFVPFTLFTIGIFGIFVNRKYPIIIICVELILLSFNNSFILL